MIGERLPPSLYALYIVTQGAALSILITASQLKESQWHSPLALAPSVPSIIHSVCSALCSEDKIADWTLGRMSEVSLTMAICLLLNPGENETIQTISLTLLSTIAAIGILRTAWDVYQVNARH